MVNSSDCHSSQLFFCDELTERFLVVTGLFAPKTIRSQERKFQVWNFRSLEPSFLGTFAPWNFLSLELSFLRTGAKESKTKVQVNICF